jgi:MoxR-like ATPase
MLDDEAIEVYKTAKTLNRHGLIAGATGIRKTKLFKFYCTIVNI